MNTREAFLFTLFLLFTIRGFTIYDSTPFCLQFKDLKKFIAPRRVSNF
jgi:hypothetical protein